MQIDLRKKTALITGSGRGIGRACAIELAKSGANIILNDRPGSTDLDATKSEIQKLGAKCEAIAADVFTRQGCESLMDGALGIFSSIDILISTTAFAGTRQSFLKYDHEDFEKGINGTLIGGFHMAQLVARQMVSFTIHGKILFISSVQAEMPFAQCAAYGSAKAGLNHLMRTISVELSQHRINVNAIQPGWIDTPGERNHFSEDEILQEGQLLPWGRLGRPEEVGKAACFLVSNQSDYITGTVLTVDGGFLYKDCQSPFLDKKI